MKKTQVLLFLLAFSFISAFTTAQTATPYWTEDFSNGMNSSNGTWTLEGPDSLWKHSFYGTSGEWSVGTPQPQFTTAANGFMLFDADSANWPNSPNYVDFTGSLVSPLIDLSNEPSCVLEFDNYARSLKQTGDRIVVEVSADDGVTWTMFNVSDILPQPSNPETVALNISPYVIGSSTVRIKFTFGHHPIGHYFWAIDDIRLYHTQVNDLVIQDVHYDTITGALGIPIDYSIIPSYFNTVFHPTATIYNAGSAVQTNVELTVDVEYNGSPYVSLMSTPSTSSPWVTDSITTNELNQLNSPGEYLLTYSVSQDEVDEFPLNNTDTTSFEITNMGWGQLYARDRGLTGYFAGVDAGNGNYSSFELGNLFEIPVCSNVHAISAYVGPNSEVGNIIYGVVYVYDPVLDEFNYMEQSLDHTITANDLGNWVSLPTMDNVLYGNDAIIWAAVGNYGGPDLMTIGAAQPIPANTAYFLDGTDNTWYATSKAAMVRPEVDYCIGGLSDEVLEEVTLHPNPNNGNFTLSNVQAGTTIKVYNGLGQLMLDEQLQNTQSNHQIDGLSPGMYFVHLQLDGANRTLKMVVE